MCRMTLAAATVLALGLATPVLAASKSVEPAKVPAVAAPSPEAGPAAPAKATAQERAEVARLDPLARAAFWSNQAQIDPRDPVAGVNLAQALRGLGRYEEAAAAAGAVLIMAPDNMDALLEAARAHVERGQGFYAVERLTHAIQLAPKDWRPVSLMAIAYEQTSRDAEALASHRAAVALAPDAPVPLANLAMYLAGHDQLGEAETLLRRAAAMPAANAQVRQNLAMVLGLQGRVAEAEPLLRRDLPPEQANANLALLRAANSGPATRSWDAVRAQ